MQLKLHCGNYAQNFNSAMSSLLWSLATTDGQTIRIWQDLFSHAKLNFESWEVVSVLLY